MRVGWVGLGAMGAPMAACVVAAGHEVTGYDIALPPVQELVRREMESAATLSVPLVVRLEGTNVDLGKKIMAESGLPIISADNLADAAEKVVKAVKGAK